MSHRVLITGGSGYLGGTLLAHLADANLPPYEKLFALVRTDAQADAVKKLYGAEPLSFDTFDEAAVHEAVVSNRITVVYFLINPIRPEPPTYFIRALAQVKKETGLDVHFLHTTGAKLFSSHVGAPTDRPLLDTDPELYDIQKALVRDARTPHARMLAGVNTNCLVIEQAEAHGVRSYIFAPCIVYGRGEGFGNPISIQTVAVVKAARALGRMYSVDEPGTRPTWPVCHVRDNTTLYIELLRAILAGENPGHGKSGYYLASPGSVAWEDLYIALAEGLARHSVIADATVVPANDAILEKMGAALGCPKDFVPVQVGGKCTFTAEHGQKELGWRPAYKPEHILEAAGEEVDLILQNMK